MSQSDTARRSLDHWSDAGRSEMLAFYALATEDYRQLAVAEGFLQRCAFDDTVSLEEMENSGALGDYPKACRGTDGAYQFQHEAHVITWEQR